MKHLILIFTNILLCIIFSSCHRIHDGIITEKHIIPAHTYSYSTMMMIGKVPITTWHTGYVNDEYILTVRNIKGSDTISERFSVNSTTYECKLKGDYFNDTIPCEIYKPK